MAIRYPSLNTRPNFSYITPQQNQQMTLIPLSRDNQRQRENSENQNNWINNMNFLAMAGNLAGNLDWKTLLGMAFGFGLTGMLPKLFDRDKKQAVNENSMNEYLIKQDDGIFNDSPQVGILPIATDKPEIAIPDKAGTHSSFLLEGIKNPLPGQTDENPYPFPSAEDPLGVRGLGLLGNFGTNQRPSAGTDWLNFNNVDWLNWLRQGR